LNKRADEFWDRIIDCLIKSIRIIRVGIFFKKESGFDDKSHCPIEYKKNGSKLCKDISSVFVINNGRVQDSQMFLDGAVGSFRCGYYAVRMGARVKNSILCSNSQVIDYATNGQRTDFNDIYIYLHWKSVTLFLVFRRRHVDNSGNVQDSLCLCELDINITYVYLGFEGTVYIQKVLSEE
jgi:hypothetical protein